MINRKSILFVLFVLMLVSSQGFAFEAKTPVTDSITIDESLKLLYDMTEEDKDLHFFAAINRFNIQANKGDFLYGLRYDVEAYFEKEEYAVKYVPEKFFFQYDHRYWDARIGDFYSNLGRGLTLSILKHDQFGEDNTIQGGTAGFRSTYFNARALGGWFNESDDLEFKPERAKHGEPEYDDRDVLFGGGFTTGHPSYIVAGCNYIQGQLPVPDDTPFPEYEDDDSIQIISATLEAPDFIIGNFFGEYAWLVYKDDKRIIEDQEYEGRGAYAGLMFYGGPVTITGEYQDYFRFEFTHNEPPNLEYEKTTFSHAPRTDDIIGGRGRLDFVVPKIDTLLYGAYYHAASHEAGEVFDRLKDHYYGNQDWIKHGYGGFEQTFSNAAFVFGSGGYREIVEGRWVHGEFDAGYPVVARHQLAAGAHVKQFAGMNMFRDTEYTTQEYSLEYDFAPYVNVTARYEHSDEPLSGGVGDEADDDPHFYSGQVTVEPVEQVRVSLFYGRERGGLQCSGGLCRFVPPFEGARLDLQLRF